MSAELTKMLKSPNVMSRLQDALGGSMSAEQYCAQIIISLNDEKFADCTPESKFSAAHKCAALGLLPSLQQVALIPRRNKQTGQRELTVMPQWQGLQSLMLRHPDVLSIRAALVHQTDRYAIDPATGGLAVHEYDPFDPDREFKSIEDVRGGYLVIKWRDNRPHTWHFVTQRTIQQSQQCSDPRSDVWTKWFMEQALKTVYRNAYARRVVPIDPLVNSNLEKAIQAEDAALDNDPARIEPPPAETPTMTFEPEPVSRSQQLIEQIAEPEESVAVAVEEPPEDEPAPLAVPKPKRKRTKKKVEDPQPNELGVGYKEFSERIAKSKDIQELHQVLDLAGAALAIDELTTKGYNNLEVLVRQKETVL